MRDPVHYQQTTQYLVTSYKNYNVVATLGRIWLHCNTPQPNKAIRIQVLVWALISKEIAPRDHYPSLMLASALHTFSLPMAQ